MKTRCKTLSALVQAFLVFAWLMKLTDTDSIYNVYVLCAFLGIFCIFEQYRCPHALSKMQKTFVGFLAVSFSAAVVLANYTLVEDVFAPFFRFDLVCLLLGGFALAQNILYVLLTKTPYHSGTENRGHCRVWFFVIFLSIAGIDLLYLFSSAYPGVLTLDSFGSIWEFMGGNYSNINPFCYTMTVKFFYSVGYFLFGNANAGIAFFVVFQVLFMAACFAYMLVTLYQLGIPKVFCAGVYAMFALLPYNIVYSVTVWKDVLFAAGMLLMVTACCRILRNVGSASILDHILFAVGGLGVALWRTNGWYVFLIITLVLLFVVKKDFKVLRRIALGILLAGWVLIQLVMPALQVKGTDFIEAFSIPLQQIARVVSNEGYLAPEEWALLEEGFDVETIREEYNPYLADPVKWSFRKDNRDYVEENFFEYVKMWLRIGRRYPGEYVKAWIDQTKGYWNGGYEYWIYASGVEDNTFGIYRTGGGNAISRRFENYFYLMEYNGVLDPLYSIGLHVWILLACFAVNLLKKRREALLAVPALVVIAGLWIGTPVYAEFRYAYPMLLTLPLILGTTLFSLKDNNCDVQ